MGGPGQKRIQLLCEKAWHLAPKGAVACDTGTTPRHWDCEAAAKLAIAATGVKRESWGYQASAWPHVPHGCSVRHYDGHILYSHHLKHRGNGNNGHHQLVCVVLCRRRLSLRLMRRTSARRDLSALTMNS